MNKKELAYYYRIYIDLLLDDWRFDSRFGFIYIMCGQEGITLPDPCPARKAFELYKKKTGISYEQICWHWFRKRVPKYAQNRKDIDKYDPEDYKSYQKGIRSSLKKGSDGYYLISGAEGHGFNNIYHSRIKGHANAFVSMGDYFYIVHSEEFDSYKVSLKVEIKGNEDLIREIKKKYKGVKDNDG